MLLIIVASAALASASSMSCGDSARPGAREADRIEIERLDRLGSTSQSPAEIFSVLSPDLVLDNVSHVVRRGIDQVKAGFVEFSQAYSNYRAEIIDMHAVVDCNMGYVTSHQRVTAQGINGAANLHTIFRQTDIFEKSDGKWLITYEHVSAPIDYKTGRVDPN